MCFSCLQVHMQETGHCSKTDLVAKRRNDPEDMRGIFSGSVSEGFFTLFESFPEVQDYACMTSYDFFRSNITLQKEPFKNQRFIHDLSYPQYRKLLRSNNNDMMAFSEAYAQSVIADIRQTIAPRDAKPEEQQQTPQRTAEVSRFRHVATKTVLLLLAAIWLYLMINAFS